MTLLRHSNHHLSIVLTAFIFLLFFSSSATRLSQLGSWFQEKEKGEGGRGLKAFDRVLTQTRLSASGSSPPTCISKCGKCFPCEPVTVPVHPRFRVQVEYYPIAWRCKCGDKLFMP